MDLLGCLPSFELLFAIRICKVQQSNCVFRRQFDLIGVQEPEAVFLIMLGTSSFPAKQEVYGETTEKFVPSWERARIQHD